MDKFDNKEDYVICDRTEVVEILKEYLGDPNLRRTNRLVYDNGYWVLRPQQESKLDITNNVK